MREESFRAYLDFMDQLGETLDRLTELEKEKTAAVRRDDLLAVEACMKREQAMSLSLRSMDRKRDRLLDELGLGGIPLSGFVRACPEEFRIEARAAEERLRTRYMLYRSAADVARTTLECNLHQIEKMMPGEAEAPMGRGTIADIRA